MTNNNILSFFTHGIKGQVMESDGSTNLEDIGTFKRSSRSMTKSNPKENVDNLDDMNTKDDPHPKKKSRNIISDDEHKNSQDSNNPSHSSPKKSTPRDCIQNTLSHIDIESTDPKNIEIPEKKSFNYFQLMDKQNANARSPGTYQVPQPSHNCLLGLTFVFSGEFCEFSRDDIADYVKRYGAKVTSAPSRRTSFLVLGEDPGATKLAKAKEYDLKILNEEQLYKFISSLPPRTESGTEMSREQQRQLKAQEEKELKKQTQSIPIIPSKSKVLPDIWTMKYAPTNPSEIIGNQANVQRLGQWLQEWKRKIPDPQAVLISGPPGIGKTTTALVVSLSEGFQPLEYNASDTRSKKALHSVVKDLINNKSFKSDTRSVIIMDEVDGMSAGDRGGMNELIQLIKKTRIPIICICNDRNSQKVRSLSNYCMDLRFRRPDSRQIYPRISEICKKENISIGQNVLEQLVSSTHGDIRQILALLSNWSICNAGILDYDKGKQLGLDGRKDVDKSIFDIVGEFLSRGSYKRHSIQDLIELYFNDSSLVPLMIQENYINCKPSVVDGNNRTITDLAVMDAMERAANAIANSDVVDRRIHGSNQEWSLAPLHGFMSCVLPCWYASGSMGGRIEFAGWLGQNSRRNKLFRLLTEISIHMRLHISASKDEVRLSYLSPLIAFMTEHLIKNGMDGIDNAISLLDDYTILKEDYDAILELGIGRCDGEKIQTKISSNVKSAFTRKYNKETHSMPYAIQSSKKRIEREDDEIEDDGEDEIDITKDKMIKEKKSKKSRKKEDSYDEDDGFVVPDKSRKKK